MVTCNCCLKNKDVKEFNESKYRYICNKCFKSEEYKKIEVDLIY